MVPFDLDWPLFTSLCWALGICQAVGCFRGYALLGKLVLQNIDFDDWTLKGCHHRCRCLVHMHDNQRMGINDSFGLLCRRRSEGGK
uniref:Uncharacterized protein n=1 Tax=Rhizophora mucronata TaxID=61149 RepID=A0A2P2N1M7_RHIMU